MNLYSILQVLIAIVLIGGGSAISMVTSSASCLANFGLNTEECASFGTLLGSAIFEPQERISNAVDNLLDTESIENIPVDFQDDYINNQKQQIFFGMFISLLWILIAYGIFSTLPAMNDIGVRILLFLVVFMLLGIVQSVYSYATNDVMSMPWGGFYKLLTNLDVLTMSSDFAINMVKDIADPLG